MRRSKKQVKYDDSDDDMFVIKKSMKGSKPKNSRKLTKLEDDEYIPIKQENSDHDHQVSSLQPSSEEDSKVEKNTNIKQQQQSQRQRQRKKQVQKQTSTPNQKNTVEDTEEKMQETYNCGEENLEKAEQQLPYFVQPDFIKDAEGRSPDHPQYDKTTLHIPIQAYQQFSPMFRQFWNAKKVHYDSIMFFRCGRWVNVMYQDAILIARLFKRNLGFWGKNRPCLTVYESQIPLYSRGLLEKGYKLMIVEQLEKKDLVNREEGDIVRREITQIISRGTWSEYDDSQYEARNLMVIIQSKAPTNIRGEVYQFGVAVVDCTTNSFYLDQFVDDAHSNSLRSLVYKIRPVECILVKVNEDVEKMIRNVCNPTIIFSKKELRDIEFVFLQLKKEFMEEQSKYNNNNNNNKNNNNKQNFNQNSNSISIEIPEGAIEAEQQIDTNINKGLYQNSDKKMDMHEEQEQQGPMTLSQDYPELLCEIERQYKFEINQENYQNQERFSYYYAIQAFYFQLCYLRSLLLSDTVYRRGKFQFMDSNFQANTHLHLDSQALESLEIFEVNLQTKMTQKGSLLEFLDQCKTPFGKRTLIKWIQNPLFQKSQILVRQECVQDLMRNIEVVEEFQKKLSTLPDLERALTRCFNTIQSNRLKVISTTATESFGRSKLKEISLLLKHLKQSSETVKVFSTYAPRFHSERLRKLVSTKGLFPDIGQVLQQLEKCLLIRDGEPQPTKGLSEDYDQAFEVVSKIIGKLDDELDKWKKKLNCAVMIYHHGKIRYQIEIPEKYVEGDKKPKELMITSKKKGFQRFQTTVIENQLHKLRVAEEQLQQKLLPFINEYFTQFYTHRIEFFQLISCLQELDCLCSLAIASKSIKQSCQPTILEQSPDEEESFKLVDAFHPCLMKDQQAQWISNTIDFTNDVLLLTGPNMSGKSTLLRMVAVNIILAQMGCNIPAKSFVLKPFDRIFCRLGASDRLLEGKSTFFIELEETKTILEHATQNSLVIIDELGRGTSTYDGVAIASSVLRYLAVKIRPKMIFATHYHILLDEFAMHKNIEKCVMKHRQEGKRVVFEYKLVKGQAEKSFAANVARIAGIPEKVVKKAEQLEQSISREEERINRNREMLQQFNGIIEKYQYH